MENIVTYQVLKNVPNVKPVSSALKATEQNALQAHLAALDKVCVLNALLDLFVLKGHKSQRYVLKDLIAWKANQCAPYVQSDSSALKELITLVVQELTTTRLIRAHVLIALLDRFVLKGLNSQQYVCQVHIAQHANQFVPFVKRVPSA